LFLTCIDVLLLSRCRTKTFQCVINAAVEIVSWRR